MKLLIQRVSEATVEVDHALVGSIGPGLVVFLGITHQDTEVEATSLAHKLVHLRLFENEHSKMDRSVLEQGAAILIVSQFTLYGTCSQGRRPSFTAAAAPSQAEPLYERFIAEVRRLGAPVATGRFGASMKVYLVNDGPVTLVLER